MLVIKLVNLNKEQLPRVMINVTESIFIDSFCGILFYVLSGMLRADQLDYLIESLFLNLPKIQRISFSNTIALHNLIDGNNKIINYL